MPKFFLTSEIKLLNTITWSVKKVEGSKYFLNRFYLDKEFFTTPNMMIVFELYLKHIVSYILKLEFKI
jgi:hypothetical protein